MVPHFIFTLKRVAPKSQHHFCSPFNVTSSNQVCHFRSPFKWALPITTSAILYTHTHTHTTYPRQSPQILQKKSVFPPHTRCCIRHNSSLTLPPTVTHSLFIQCRRRDQLTYMWSYLIHTTNDLFLFQHYPLQPAQLIIWKCWFHGYH